MTEKAPIVITDETDTYPYPVHITPIQALKAGLEGAVLGTSVALFPFPEALIPIGIVAAIAGFDSSGVTIYRDQKRERLLAQEPVVVITNTE